MENIVSAAQLSSLAILKDPKANASAFDEDGWFKSGDIGYCDKESKLWYIVDRKKELIKVRGFQVAPPELEAVLLSHPEIEDAAVVGVEYKNDGTELPRFYVVRRGTTTLTPDEIYKYSAERLATYKRLDGGIILVDSTPKTPSGKILKRILREKAKAKL
jgi:4-coumarate--CoA ligase